MPKSVTQHSNNTQIFLIVFIEFLPSSAVPVAPAAGIAVAGLVARQLFVIVYGQLVDRHIIKGDHALIGGKADEALRAGNIAAGIAEQPPARRHTR